MTGVDRRTTLKWGAAVATLLAGDPLRAMLPSGAPKAKIARTGYGKDPPLLEPRRDAWPLTLDAAMRRGLVPIIDAVVPGIDGSPPGSAVGLVDFFDEWLSAPYPAQIADRALVLPMLEGLMGKPIVDALAALASRPDKGFARFCVLAAAAYHTTPDGITALGFVGNEPRDRFDGPPPDVLAHLEAEFAKLGLKP